MLSLTHASVGAVAGEFIPNPLLAFLVGIILHFIFDKIPHFWPKESSKKGLIIVLDTIFSVLFIISLFFFPIKNQASVIAGAAGGVSVDFYFVLIMRSQGKWAQWHTNRQHHMTNPWWLLTDVSILSFFLYLLSVVVK
jgi:hypothetical protein